MIEDLRAGDTFAGAAAAHPEAFPPYYVGILESAEMTGNLDSALNQLADYIDRDTEARAKFVSAMVYPGDRARHVGRRRLRPGGVRAAASSWSSSSR